MTVVRFLQTLLRGRFFCLMACAGCVPGLTACQAAGAGAFGSLGVALHSLWSSPVRWDRLSNQHEYLLLRVQGRDAVMVLGKRADDAKEDWFSARREWLRLRDGRIQAVQGMQHDWHVVQGEAPAWTQVDASPVSWERVRDAMPGYRHGVRDRVHTRAVAAPTSGLPTRLKPAPDWRWYEDEILSVDEMGQSWAFRQRFAMARGKMVYSEQCTAPQWCFQMIPRAGAGADR